MAVGWPYARPVDVVLMVVRLVVRTAVGVVRLVVQLVVVLGGRLEEK